MPRLRTYATQQRLDNLNPSQVFVAGLSAGGAMAAVLGATYPDVYRAIGVHSGLAFKSASDVVSAFAAMRGDHRAPDAGTGDAGHDSQTRAIVFHGDADPTVHRSNAERVVAAYAAAQPGDVRRVESGEIGGRPFTRTEIRTESERKRIELWMVGGGGGHAWSGGSVDGSFTDAAGPDASREMVRFFLEMPR